MRIRLAALATAFALAVPLSLPAGAAHAAPQKYVGCTWQLGHKDQTLACGPEFTRAGVAVFSQCWRFRPAPATVQRRVGAEWVRTPLRVKVIETASSCRTSVPWRSMVSVPVTGRHLGKSVGYQIVLPGTDKYRRTTLAFRVCVVTVGTTTPCR